MHEKLTKCPNFTFARKYFSRFFFFGGGGARAALPPSLTPMLKVDGHLTQVRVGVGVRVRVSDRILIL